MVKLATARESRIYGPRLSRNRLEYVNAGVYVFATILLLGGFTAQFSSERKSGLVLVMIGLGIITVVNLHDFLAHLAGIEYRMGLVSLDPQLAYVEFGVPLILAIGTFFSFLGILFLVLQAERGYGGDLQHHALNLLLTGAVLWLLGCIFNACQVYEEADAYVQLLQQSVYIPFLMGSFLLLVGASLNNQSQAGYIHHGWHLLGETFIWFGVLASILLFIGGITNVAKVYKMQQVHVLRLERLRGGAQNVVNQVREGIQEPMIASVESGRMTAPTQQGGSGRFHVGPTPYKDTLLSNA